LCVGGGPAGLMAAIRASELGASVVVADKGNTLYSGSGAAGNDHFECYIPEYHGTDLKPIMKAYLSSPLPAHTPEFAQTMLEKSFDVVKLWDSWGIPMKYKGKWEFAGHALPGRIHLHLKYAGQNQKQALTKQTLENGAKIMNRVTVFDLLTEEGRVVGALGYDTSRDAIIEFQAKAVCLGTGKCVRLFNAMTPGWITNLPVCPYVTGDGRAMLYRAGGELADMECIGQWGGLKYFARAGKATWIGVFRTSDDRPIGPFITKPNKDYGDCTSDIYPTVFNDYMRSGRGPVYMDCRGAPNEDIEYMKYWLLHEGNKGVLDAMAQEGIDPGRNAIEFSTYEVTLKGGILFNAKGETSLSGLFGAGQEYDGGISFAAVFGREAGESAFNYAKGAAFGDTDKAGKKVEERIRLLETFLSRQEGAYWKEANFALQQIMSDYAGLVRSETLLDQGLRNLSRLKERIANNLVARNGHELGRCIEVLNLLDVGEVVMHCAKERKETRGRHNRPDYPFTNPLLDKVLYVRQENGKPVFDWRHRM